MINGKRIKNIQKMAIIKKVRGKSPVYGNGCWFADNASILGDVTMGDDCNIWFGAVGRAVLPPHTRNIRST